MLYTLGYKSAESLHPERQVCRGVRLRVGNGGVCGNREQGEYKGVVRYVTDHFPLSEFEIRVAGADGVAWKYIRTWLVRGLAANKLRDQIELGLSLGSKFADSVPNRNSRYRWGIGSNARLRL